jgi:hypothetical protein
MALRYLGERGPEYLVPTYERPRYLIRFTPSKIISWEGVEWAQHYLNPTEGTGNRAGTRDLSRPS